MALESLSKDVFERRASTGSEVFSLTMCLDAKKFVLISFFFLIRAIYLRVSTKPPPNDAKRPFPVDVRRSKTLLLKLPITYGKTQSIRSLVGGLVSFGFPSQPRPQGFSLKNGCHFYGKSPGDEIVSRAHRQQRYLHLQTQLRPVSNVLLLPC